MDGRWKCWLASGIFLSLVGCTHSNTVPPPVGSPVAANKPKQDDKRDKKDGQLSPDTLVAIGNAHVGAAMEENHSAGERQALLKSANDEYTQALQRDPKNMRAYGGLAQMYTYLGDKEKALDTYRQAAKLAPNNADVCVAMALCCKQFNDRDGAVKYLHEATKINPTDRRLKINLGFELAMATRYEEGYAWLERTLGATKAHYSVAQVCEHQGNKVKAQQELQLALQIDPNYRPAHELMARLSDPEQAIPAENGSGIKTVGFQDWSSIPESRLAPNARLISQPDFRQPASKNEPLPPKSLPAASIQAPDQVPGNEPRPLPPMPIGTGWER